MPQFAIVEFLEEGSVSIVSTNWLSDCEKFCFWPCVTYKERLAKKHTAPESTWQNFGWRIYGKTDQYNEVNLLLRKAQTTSNFESAEDTRKNRRKSSCRVHRAKMPEYSFSESPADSSDSDNNKLKIPSESLTSANSNTLPEVNPPTTSFPNSSQGSNNSELVAEASVNSSQDLVKQPLPNEDGGLLQVNFQFPDLNETFVQNSVSDDAIRNLTQKWISCRNLWIMC